MPSLTLTGGAETRLNRRIPVSTAGQQPQSSAFPGTGSWRVKEEGAQIQVAGMRATQRRLNCSGGREAQ